MPKRPDALGIFWAESPPQKQKEDYPDIEVNKDWVLQYRRGYSAAFFDVMEHLFEKPFYAPNVNITAASFKEWCYDARDWIDAPISDVVPLLCCVYELDEHRPSPKLLPSQQHVNMLYKEFCDLLLEMRDPQLAAKNLSKLAELKERLQVAIDNMDDEVRVQAENQRKEDEKIRLMHGFADGSLPLWVNAPDNQLPAQ